MTRAQAVLDVVAEDPQEQHVAQQVQPGTVHEEGIEQAERRRNAAREGHGPPRAVGADRDLEVAALDQLGRDQAVLDHEIFQAGGPGQRLQVGGAQGLLQVLAGQVALVDENRKIEQDEQDDHHGRSPGRIIILERNEHVPASPLEKRDPF